MTGGALALHIGASIAMSRKACQNWKRYEDCPRKFSDIVWVNRVTGRVYILIAAIFSLIVVHTVVAGENAPADSNCRVDTAEYEKMASDMNATREQLERSEADLYFSYKRSAKCYINSGNFAKAREPLAEMIGMDPASNAVSVQLVLALISLYENPKRELPPELQMFDEEWPYVSTLIGQCAKAAYLAGVSGESLRQDKYAQCKIYGDINLRELRANLDKIIERYLDGNR